MYALHDDQRKNLMILSVMMVFGGLAILPLTVPPTSLLADARSVPARGQFSIPVVPGRLQFPVISVKRDPFAPDGAAIAFADTAVSPTASVRQGDDIGVVLPANAGADGVPVQGSTAGDNPAALRGLVLGDVPEALIETSAGIKVFGIGDRLDGATIASIDARGVTLSSGVVLSIPGGRQ